MLSSELLKKIQRIVIKSRFLANDVFAGEYKAAFRGRGMEFEEVRDYNPGDDIRSIDWNVTARMDKPFVKVFREERERSLMLIMDLSSSLNFGSQKETKKERLTEIAAVLAHAATKENDKVGLLLFSDCVERFIPPKKGRAHVWKIVQEVLSYEPKGKETNLEGVIQFLSQVLHRKTICFLLSDFLFDKGLEKIKTFSLRHDLVSMVLNDQLEDKLMPSALVNFKDLESGLTKTFDLSNFSFRRAFDRKQVERKKNLKKFFDSYRIDSLFLRTDEDYIDPLMKFFKLREKRI